MKGAGGIEKLSLCQGQFEWRDLCSPGGNTCSKTVEDDVLVWRSPGKE